MAETAVTEATPMSESTEVVEYGTSGEAQEAHFQAALDAALKVAPLEEINEPVPADPAKVQEAADTEALKAKEKDEEEAEKPEVEPKKDEVKDATPAGTLGKARRLFTEGDVVGAIKLALGVDIENVELSGKQWRAIKHYSVEAKQEADEARAKAEQEVAQAQHVVQTLDPFIKGAQAYLAGDFETFLKLTTGDTPEQFQRKLIGQLHEAPKADPALLARLEAVERERQAERAAAEELRQKNEKLEKQHAYEQAVVNWKHEVSTELKAVPQYAKVADKAFFVDRVFALQEAHYDKRTRTTIDTLDAAEQVWDELYGGVVETPQPAGGQAGSNPAPRVSGEQTGQAGASTAVSKTTTLRHTQATEAAPELTQAWSPENQEKILERYTRMAKTEMQQLHTT